MFTHNLADQLREELGGWWADPLYTLSQGMDTLSKAFMQPNKLGWNNDVDLSKNIIYGFIVDTVTENDYGVTVSGMNKTTHERMTFKGDAVFLTLQLQILRQIKG